MQGHTVDEAVSEVLDFWFGPQADDASIAERQDSLWWQKRDETDREISERFGALHHQASLGELEHWADSPQGRLALIIVLDQFSRNIHRDSPKAFAQDYRALAHSLSGQTHGQDRELRTVHRVFFYMPMEHAESLPVQDECVRRFEGLLAEATPEKTAPFEKLLDYARRHRDVVLRFDRFPHRNAILGRDSTPAELEFLKQPGSSF